MPVSSLGNDPPTFEEYAEWYEDRFYEELYGSPVQNWYRDQTELGQMRLSDSEFWRTLLSRLKSWNANYSELTGGYPLWLSEPAPMIMTKPFDSVIHKSWRWNVLVNGNWPDPPGRPRRSTAPQDGSIDRDDKFQWFGPHNWLTDFPDIFRTRLVTTYFDGVGNLANNEVTPSSGSDTDVTVPLVDGLAERKVRPDELFADTAYGSGRNAFEASRRGTELVSPVAGSAPGNSHEGEGDGPPPLTGADFQIDVTGEQATVCPAGHRSVEEYELEDAPERVEVHFARATCEPCPLRSRCPVKLDRRAGAYVLKADLVKVNIEGRRRARGHRGVAQAVCHKGRDRGDKLRAEARPRAWALAGARGPSGAACRLPEDVGVQLQADGPCTPGGDGKHGSAGGRDGTCGRSRVRAPLHNFHRAP